MSTEPDDEALIARLREAHHRDDGFVAGSCICGLWPTCPSAQAADRLAAVRAELDEAHRVDANCHDLMDHMQAQLEGRLKTRAASADWNREWLRLRANNAEDALVAVRAERDRIKADWRFCSVRANDAEAERDEARAVIAAVRALLPKPGTYIGNAGVVLVDDLRSALGSSGTGSSDE